MKLGTLNEGDLVVVNDLPDATLYVVLEVDRFNVQVREAGTDYRPEWQDISIFQKPNRVQMGA